MTKWLYAVLALQLILVSIIDLKHKRISNIWSIFNLVFAVILWSLGHLGPWTYQVLIFPIGFIVIGFFLFIVKIMGAGDSKYLASLFLCLPFALHVTYFEKLILSTIVVGSLLLIGKILRDPKTFKAYLLSRHWIGIRNMMKSHFSYAPVMLLAWLLMGATIWF